MQERFIATFFSMLKNKYGVCENTFKVLLPYLAVERYDKNEVIESYGNSLCNIYFVAEGIVGAYLHDGDFEIPAYYAFKNDCVSNLDTLWTSGSSRFSLVAKEDSFLVKIKKNMLMCKVSNNKRLLFLMQSISQEIVNNMVSTHLSFKMEKTTEISYFALLKNESLYHKLPIKEVSVLLGIHPNSLSRIRKNLKQET